MWHLCLKTIFFLRKNSSQEDHYSSMLAAWEAGKTGALVSVLLTEISRKLSLTICLHFTQIKEGNRQSGKAMSWSKVERKRQFKCDRIIFFFFSFIYLFIYFYFLVFEQILTSANVTKVAVRTSA